MFNIELLAGSLEAPCSYSWIKSSDEYITERLKWPSIHQCHVYFSTCKVHDILHHCNFVTTSSLSLFSLFHLPSIPTVNHFMLTVHSYGTLFLMPSSGSNSSAHFTLPFIVFFYDFITVISCCVNVFVAFMCLYIISLINCGNFSCTYKLFVCRYIVSYVYILVSMYVYVGSMFAGCPSM